MTLPRFEYLAPASVEEACALADVDSAFLAGGTDLLVCMKQRLHAPLRVIGLAGIAELRGIARTDEDGLRVGAATTLTELADWASTHPEWASLSDAIRQTSSPLLRNAGTVGGNLCLDTRCTFYNQPPIFRARWGPCLKLGGGTCHAVRRSTSCHAVYSGDLAGPLIAWSATATIATAEGRRRKLAVNDLFTGEGIHPLGLGPDEILVEIEIPKPPPTTRFSYQKLRLRDTLDFPLAGVSLFAEVDTPEVDAPGADTPRPDTPGADASVVGARLHGARVVLNATGPAPLLLPEAGALLEGREVDEALAVELGELLQKSVKFAGNTAAGSTYRKAMIPVLARRALRDMCR